MSDRQAQKYIDADARRMADPRNAELAQERQKALAGGWPDPGWDYSICGDHPPTAPGQPSPMAADAKAGKLPAAMRGIEQAIRRKMARPDAPAWVRVAMVELLQAALAILITATLSEKQPTD